MTRYKINMDVDVDYNGEFYEITWKAGGLKLTKKCVDYLYNKYGTMEAWIKKLMLGNLERDHYLWGVLTGVSDSFIKHYENEPLYDCPVSEVSGDNYVVNWDWVDGFLYEANGKAMWRKFFVIVVDKNDKINHLKGAIDKLPEFFEDVIDVDDNIGKEDESAFSCLINVPKNKFNGLIKHLPPETPHCVLKYKWLTTNGGYLVKAEEIEELIKAIA